MRKNFKLVIRYDGSRYHGWEKKRNLDTIQGKIETVLTRMDGEEVHLIGAGRTDAGVHARAMTANVHLQTFFSTEKIKKYMNTYLPDDIAIVEVKEVSERFHARYHAVGKTYRYTFYDGEDKPVFDRKYVTVTAESPDIDKMREAASLLEGRHDFKSFCGNPKMKKSTVRTVDSIRISRQGDRIHMDFHGDGFLQHMVRILAGTLLEVGVGRRRPEEMPEILSACDRKKAGPTAPPGGLCLMEVEYH